MSEIVAHAVSVLRTEAGAIADLAETIGGQGLALEAACALIHGSCGEGRIGRLVVTGIGKAGHIGKKLAATFASTGTPSFFLHPAEARHGDLGMVQSTDIILALSNSGSSEELIALLPSISLIGCELIAIVGRPQSPLARHADQVLSFGRVMEACPLGLAPSTSTTTMLALGDAIALTVQHMRSFTPEQYARYHPGGALGRKLMTCTEAMRAGDRVPAVTPDTPVLACLKAITSARAGSIMMIDGERRLLGIFTDGDLRRALTEAGDAAAVLNSPARDHASIPCHSVRGGELLQKALHQCSEYKLNELPVVDDDGRLIGLLDVQDLIDRGFEMLH